MALGKNQQQLSEDLATSFTADDQQTDADISNGTVNRDLMDIAATKTADAYLALEETRLSSSLKNADSISVDALSQYAMNFDVLRAAATKATGTVTFQAVVKPTSNIGIPGGTLIFTQPLLDGTVITYTTDADATLATTATKNPLNGLYEVDVSVTASTAGTASHIGMNSLTVLPNRIAGISSITNKVAISNATDDDTNAVLATSIRTKTSSNILGTPSGYEEAILAAFPDDVTGVAIVGPFDPDNLRAQYGNEVDVPIISTDATSFTEVLTTGGSNLSPFVTSKPVLTVTSVVGATNGTNYRLNVNYGFNNDTSTVYGFSTQSLDALCWFPGQVPGPGVRLNVQGTKDAVVAAVQAYLDVPTRHYVTSGLLVKIGQEVPIDISVAVSTDSGSDRDEIATNVVAAITDALNAYALGTDVLEDDIVDIVNTVSGVFSVDIPFTTLRKSSDTDSSSSITIRAQEYARPGTITVSTA